MRKLFETTVEESMTTDYVTTEETSSTHIPPDMSLQEKLAEIMSSRNVIRMHTGDEMNTENMYR